MRPKTYRKRKIPRKKLLLVPVWSEEQEYIYRKSFSVGLPAAEYVRGRVIPIRWRLELEELMNRQGTLPKRSGRPKYKGGSGAGKSNSR